MIGRTRTHVCREAFFSLHAVTDKRIKRLRNLLVQGKIPNDERGKTKSASTILGTEIAKVHDHLASFPIKETHYSGRDYYYLDSELNIKTMYSLFIKKFLTSPIKYEYYNKIFRESFDLLFGRPQVDVQYVAFARNYIKLKI